MRNKTISRRAFLALTGASGAALALAACAAPVAPTPAPEVEPTTAQQQPTAEPTSAPPVELIYCYGAVVELKDLQLVQDEMNKIMLERINATITLNVVPYASYNDKMATRNAAGEKWDLSYSAMTRNPYFANVTNGAFADLTDALPQFAPKYYADINPSAWGAIKVKGKVYAGINQQLWAGCWGAICRKDLAEKYKLDLSKINQVEDMEPWQEAIVKGEAGKVVPYRQGTHMWFYPMYGLDQAGYGHVDMEDKDLKVWHAFDHPQWQRIMKLTKKWFQLGYFPKEQVPEGERDAWTRAGKDAWLVHRAAPGGNQGEKIRNGYETVSKVLENPIHLSTGSIVTTTAVGQKTSSVEACCKYLDLVNTDKPFFNLLAKGIEGKHWVWVDKAKEVIGFPEGLDVKNHPYNPSTDFIFGNVFNGYYIDAAQVGTYDEMRELNSSAKPSSILGFVLDTAPIKNELAALTALATEFNDLQYGLLDYDTVLPDMISKYKAAGADKVVAEIQKQLNDWKATK